MGGPFKFHPPYPQHSEHEIERDMFDATATPVSTSSLINSSTGLLVKHLWHLLLRILGRLCLAVAAQIGPFRVFSGRFVVLFTGLEWIE